MRRVPSTTPALAAKSAIVSNTLRGAFDSRSNCSIRASMISIAGSTWSVAASTSSRVTPGPASGRPSTKASSTSTRGAMKRSIGMSPAAKNMSSISGAKSGSSICDACCIAREVRPILRPLTTRPSASSRRTHSRWIA